MLDLLSYCKFQEYNKAFQDLEIYKTYIMAMFYIVELESGIRTFRLTLIKISTLKQTAIPMADNFRG